MWRQKAVLTACAGAASSFILGSSLQASAFSRESVDDEQLPVPANILASSARAAMRPATVIEVSANSGEVSVNGSPVRLTTNEKSQSIPTPNPQKSETVSEPYMALFLDEESRSKLAEIWGRFGEPGTRLPGMPHMPLASDPSPSEMHYFASVVSTIGQKYSVEVDWIASDEHVLTALVLAASVPEDLVPPNAVDKAWRPHVTMAVTNPERDNGKYSARYSQVLIDRIAAIASSETILQSKTPSWAGVLPPHESSRSSGDGPYSSCAAMVRRPVHTGNDVAGTDESRAAKAASLVAGMVRLTGTVCRSDKWDGANCSWGAADSAAAAAAHADAIAVPAVAEAAVAEAAVAEAVVAEGSTEKRWPKGAYDIDPDVEICGFCRYMKEGPCGKVFALWEDCILTCRDNEDDFVDKCADLTFDLKDCTDGEQTYYHLLKEVDTDDDEPDPTEPPPQDDL